MVWQYVVVALAVILPVLTYYKKALTIAASMLASLMVLIALIAGVNYALFLVTAFLLITIVDKGCKNGLKHADDEITLKTGTRDIVQVFANGGVSLICVLLWRYTNKDVFLLCFICALIESFGDSAASDIGIAIGQQAYDICRFRKVQNGMSGGVTIAGTMGCFIACCILSGLAFAFGTAKTIMDVGMLIIASFAGCLVDSILGSLVQRKNKCKVCGKITEKNEHCMTTTERCGGVRFINNDMVNLTCNAIAAVLIYMLV